MATTVNGAGLWTGRILKGLLCLFLLFDGVMKIIRHNKSVEGTTRLGLPESCVQFLGIYLFAATALYAVSKTAPYGILLLIAYLGGATAIMYLSKPAEWGFIFPGCLCHFIGPSRISSKRQAPTNYIAKNILLMSFQAYIDNIKAQTGKTPGDFKKFAEESGFLENGKIKSSVKATEITDWIKKEFALGHGHAMAIYATFKGKTD